MKVQLYSYLGINEEGVLSLYVSQGRLNPIGARLEKGTPLPRSVREFDPNYEDKALVSMMDLQDYFDQQVKEKKRK